MNTSVLQWDHAAVREQFPFLERTVHGKPLIYLDSAATAQKPQSVIDATVDFYANHNANVHRGVHALSQEATDLFENARETVRQFLNAKEARNIVFTKGCTEAINLVAHSYVEPKLKAGDAILVSHTEHHSNIVPWQQLAKRKGATLRVIPITDDGHWDLTNLDELLDGVSFVAVGHASNALGTINPVKEVIQRSHAAGASVLVDGAQAGPHIRIDLADLDVDFYTLSCHKIYAPTGVGVLAAKPGLLESMEPYQTGGSMIRTVSFEETTWADVPDRFEGGTPNIAGVVGLAAALKWLMGQDRVAIERHEAALARYAFDNLGEISGIRLHGTPDQNIGIASFSFADLHAHDLGTILDREGVAIRAGHHCCMPLMKRLGVAATARASFGIYSLKSDVDALVSAVQKAKEIFA